MNRITHFEIQSGDINASKEFFNNTFGWTYDEWTPGYALTTLAQDAPGINGAVMSSNVPMPHANATVLTATVDNLDEMLAKATDLGAEIQFPKTVVPGAGYVAYIKAPGDVMLGMWQADPNAAG